MLILAKNIYTAFADKVRRKYKVICGDSFECRNEVSLSILLDMWIFLSLPSNYTSSWRQPHQKPLFIDIRDCVRRKLSAADNFAKLCKVGVDYTRVACMGTLTVDSMRFG